MSKKNLLKINHIELIHRLRKNSRIPLTKVAEELNIPVTTTHDSYKKIKKYVVKHTALLDYSKMGFKIRSIIILHNNEKCDSSDTFDYILNSPYLNNAYKLDGEKYYFDIIFKNFAQQQDFLETIESKNPKSIEEYKIIDDIMQEEFKISQLPKNRNKS